jgi:uncharacterized protein (TIGR01777 family)
MRVFITGGTGLIGRNLVRRLAERGDVPVILSRRADHVRRDPSMRSYRVVQGDPAEAGPWTGEVDGCDAVINLAGHNIFAERWTATTRRKIRDSRVYGTENVVAAIAAAKNPPRTLVQASAIGYYGAHGDEELTEESPGGSDFMARVCREWEDAAVIAQAHGVRVARIRTGIVLARGDGALGVMTPIFKLGGAAPVGSHGSLFTPGTGAQWMSWIHRDDITGIFLMALDNREASGPINGTAPQPVRNSEFSRALARVLWRPYIPFGPPELVLRLVLGQVAEVITEGQRVLPTRAQALGYTFKYPDLASALRNLFAPPMRLPKPEPIPTAAAAHHHHH